MSRTYTIVDKSSTNFRAVHPYILVIAEDGAPLTEATYASDNREDAERYGQIWERDGITPFKAICAEERDAYLERRAKWNKTPAATRDPRWSW